MSQSTQEKIVNHHIFHACLLPAKTAELVNRLPVHTSVNALQVRNIKIIMTYNYGYSDLMLYDKKDSLSLSVLS